MFDIGMWELLIIGVVALMVVGPKDLPKLMRQVAQWMRAARRMANEFQRHVDDVMRESEPEELRKEVNSLRNPANLLLGTEPRTQATVAPAAPAPAATVAAPSASSAAPPPTASEGKAP